MRIVRDHVNTKHSKWGLKNVCCVLSYCCCYYLSPVRTVLRAGYLGTWWPVLSFYLRHIVTPLRFRSKSCFVMLDVTLIHQAFRCRVSSSCFHGSPPGSVQWLPVFTVNGLVRKAPLPRAGIRMWAISIFWFRTFNVTRLESLELVGVVLYFLTFTSSWVCVVSIVDSLYLSYLK